MIDVKAFAICLSSRKQDNRNINSWIRTFKNVYRFQAVNGKEIDSTDRNIVHEYAHLAISTDESKNTLYAIPSRGAIGCYLSHLLLWKKCVEIKEPICIVEEDVYISEHATEKIKEALESIPQIIPHAHYLSLMYIGQPCSAKTTSPLFRQIKGPRTDGLQCYYLTPPGAQILLNTALPLYTQADLYIGNICHRNKEFKAYSLSERLYSLKSIVFDNFKSSVQHFSIKKYLPCSNIFYISFLCLLVICIILIIIMIL